MTEKLYYKDAYLRCFKAIVLSSEPAEEGYDIILNRTAFFPEEGGQSADNGYIGNARVLDAYESDGIIHHICDRPLSIGEYECQIDFDERYEKMQCHTAEHILCGIIHRLFGFDNVGFHLGADEVTFDINGVLDRAALDTVETEANRVVYSNLKVDTLFPEAEELSSMEYRAKLDITEGVRLVRIGEVDTCACCAPHVKATGEIGAIKILDFMKHRGGTRIWMTAGIRALLDYRQRYENIKRISGMLSVPQSEVAVALQTYMADCDDTRAALKAARLKIAELSADSVSNTDGSLVCLYPDFTIPELIAFSNSALPHVGGILVALCGGEGDYKYVISSRTEDLRQRYKDINSALSGRGGGRPEMIQGSFAASLDEIKSYFLK